LENYAPVDDWTSPPNLPGVVEASQQEGGWRSITPDSHLITQASHFVPSLGPKVSELKASHLRFPSTEKRGENISIQFLS